jgi:predicted glycosyltransferase
LSKNSNRISSFQTTDMVSVIQSKLCAVNTSTKTFVACFCTHFSKTFLRKINQWMNKFDEVWVPDFQFSPNLSGKLSHQIQFAKPIVYCGPLSRFSKYTIQNNELKKFDVCAIISGPEPHRTLFEQFCMQLAEKNKISTLIIAGKPNEDKSYSTKYLTYHSHLPTETFFQYILASKLVLSRAGYSTLMDLQVLNKHAVLVPTPGQTEQEYLIKHNAQQPLFLCAKNLDEAEKLVLSFLKTEQICQTQRLFDKSMLENCLDKLVKINASGIYPARREEE